MDKQLTVTINGVFYDAHTGMRVEGQAAAKVAAKVESIKRPVVRSRQSSTSLHAKTARTHTLSRKHVHAPVKKTVPAHGISTHKSRLQATAPHQKSPMVQRFARDVSAPSKPHIHQAQTKDIAPVVHPLQQRVTSLRQEQVTQPVPAASSKERKERAISDAMQRSSAPVAAKKSSAAKRSKNSLFAKRPRFAAIAMSSLAVVMLAGYLTYVNLPNISVRVAAAQAGIAAAYPSYRPSGYSLSGPVAFSDGQVSMKFAANAGPQNFTVNQAKSNWDSSALLDNYVYDASAGEYDTYKNAGLTIYTYGNNAAWVNGGILHTIKGDASLTNDQIRKIATSM